MMPTKTIELHLTDSQISTLMAVLDHVTYSSKGEWDPESNRVITYKNPFGNNTYQNISDYISHRLDNLR